MKRTNKILSLIVIPSLLLGCAWYAYALFVEVSGGYKLGGYSNGVYESSLTDCSIATNTSNKQFFIPTNSARETMAFNIHTPPEIEITSAAQPDCGESSQYTCDVGTDPGFHVPEYACGINDADLCYGWECQTACGSTDCTYIEVGGCFVSGTIITMFDGTKKSVESVSTGDILLGVGGSANTVEKLFKIDYRRKLYSLNGGKHFVSDTHPFMTTEGWKSFYPEGTLKESPDLAVSLLEIGDVLLTETGLVQLLSTDYIYDRQYVYNFKTDGNHTYYADGYLVHNPNDKIAH